jgi:hypothetical protein
MYIFLHSHCHVQIKNDPDVNQLILQKQQKKRQYNRKHIQNNDLRFKLQNKRKEKGITIAPIQIKTEVIIEGYEHPLVTSSKNHCSNDYKVNGLMSPPMSPPSINLKLPAIDERSNLEKISNNYFDSKNNEPQAFVIPNVENLWKKSKAYMSECESKTKDVVLTSNKYRFGCDTKTPAIVSTSTVNNSLSGCDSNTAAIALTSKANSHASDCNAKNATNGFSDSKLLALEQNVIKDADRVLSEEELLADTNDTMSVMTDCINEEQLLGDDEFESKFLFIFFK